MKIKRSFSILAGTLVAILTVCTINQPKQVNASVFQKTTVPRKFRGTWYGYDYQKKLKAFKITSSKIVLAGYGDSAIKSRTYKYTNRAHNSHADYSSHQLIKCRGNRMLMSYPMGENSAAYVANNRRKLYVGINTWVDTYYKSKAAAQKNHYADRKRSRILKLFKLVWQ
ncbi:hypothetical protein [Lactobacillus crispatus]|uniref:hypothetical protein n=1 Tax=Lactobacillus crispatus TaxID=47770 RepID=UPI0018AA613B|nr:hypothetical protein [Lactobacillus crispatus]